MFWLFCLFVGWFVCPSAGLLKMLFLNFHEIFRSDRPWDLKLDESLGWLESGFGNFFHLS